MSNIRLQFSALVLIFSAISFSATAQNDKVGVFAIGDIILPGDSITPWGGYIELQTRSNELTSQYFYYETKGGVSYDITKNHTALLGAGRYYTGENDLNLNPNSEFRMWEQFVVTQLLSRLKFEHRYRIEQRWVNGIYRNRFRYRLNLVLPLNNKKVEAKTYFLSMFDEVFFNNKAPHFERNRFSIAFGYQFNKSFSLQAGWLNQYNYNLTSAGAKNNVSVTAVYRIHRDHAKAKEHLPTTFD